MKHEDHILLGTKIISTDTSIEGYLKPSNNYIGQHVFSFESGSYTTYGKFRDKLQKIAKKSEINNSFYELINFSDCQGVIGAVVSDKLFNDFVRNRAVAYSILDDELPVYRRIYDNWTKAFEMGACNGAVVLG